VKEHKVTLTEAELDLIVTELTLREMYYQRQGPNFEYAAKAIADIRSKLYDQLYPEE
jgi:hypothetical protein